MTMSQATYSQGQIVRCGPLAVRVVSIDERSGTAFVSLPSGKLSLVDVGRLSTFGEMS